MESKIEIKKGLVLCHGHAHKSIDPYFISLAEWYYVDVDPESNPDIIANLRNPSVISGLVKPIGKLYDYILIHHCSIRPEDLKNILIFSRSILNNGGVFIFLKYFVYTDKILRREKSISDAIINNIRKDIRSFGISADPLYIRIPGFKKNEFDKKKESSMQRLRDLKYQDSKEEPDIDSLFYYGISLAKLFASESGYSSYGYLNEEYRPRYISGDIYNDKYLTICFVA